MLQCVYEGLLNEYLAEDDSTPADSLDTDVAGVDDATSQDEEPSTDDRSASALQNCFVTILDTLASNNPRFDLLYRHANIPTRGRILPLSRHVPAIPPGIHEILLLQYHQKYHFSCHQVDSFKVKMYQNMVGLGTTLDPAVGAYHTSPYPLVSWGGDTSPCSPSWH